MKVKSDFDSGFKPIELTITIESKEELISLWHRVNLSSANIMKGYALGETARPSTKPVSMFVLWEKLETIRKKLGITEF